MLVNASTLAAFSVSVPRMLTNTLACRRSRVTSTAVTVTRPMSRGSLAPERRNVATSSRIASATRSALRWFDVMLFRAASAADHRRSDARDSRRRRSVRQRARHLLRAEAFDHVVDLHVVEVLDADTAFEPLAHLAHVILEALE